MDVVALVDFLAWRVPSHLLLTLFQPLEAAQTTSVVRQNLLLAWGAVTLGSVTPAQVDLDKQMEFADRVEVEALLVCPTCRVPWDPFLVELQELEGP